MVKLIFLMTLAIASAQTRPRPDQIKNPQQVRVCCPTCPCGERVGPTTRIYTGQLYIGRFVMDPQSFAALTLSDPTTTPVCMTTYYGFSAFEGIQRQGQIPLVSIQQSGPFIITVNCFTKAGIELIRPDPFWTSWLTSNGF
jgi:hypothetical protein